MATELFQSRNSCSRLCELGLSSSRIDDTENLCWSSAFMGGGPPGSHQVHAREGGEVRAACTASDLELRLPERSLGQR